MDNPDNLDNQENHNQEDRYLSIGNLFYHVPLHLLFQDTNEQQHFAIFELEHVLGWSSDGYPWIDLDDLENRIQLDERTERLLDSLVDEGWTLIIVYTNQDRTTEYHHLTQIDSHLRNTHPDAIRVILPEDENPETFTQLLRLLGGSHPTSFAVTQNPTDKYGVPSYQKNEIFPAATRFPPTIRFDQVPRTCLVIGGAYNELLHPLVEHYSNFALIFRFHELRNFFDDLTPRNFYTPLDNEQLQELHGYDLVPIIILNSMATRAQRQRLLDENLGYQRYILIWLSRASSTLTIEDIDLQPGWEPPNQNDDNATVDDRFEIIHIDL